MPCGLISYDKRSGYPILFVVPDDPIKLGLVNSIARPTGNVTGVNFLGAEIGSKRLELLRDLLPTTNRIAVLFNPINPVGEAQKRNVLAAAQAMGLSVQIFNASTDRDIDAAFAALVRERPTHFSSCPIRYLTVGASNWSILRHAMRFPRSTGSASLLRQAG